MKTHPHKYDVHIVTMGCSKNLVDSEVLIKQLEVNQLKVQHNSSDNHAETVIINTCGFIQDAKEESIEMILQYARAKQQGLLRNLIVMGCLSQRYKDTLIKEIPEVDAFFGVDQMQKITQYLEIDYRTNLLGERTITTPGHYAHLKVSEGCDRTCAFCSIPLIRGGHVSKSMEEVCNEAKYLSENGVKELLLIAQDLSYYGLDLYREQKLKELLEELVGMNRFEWIRLHYLFPNRFPDDILPLIRENSSICNYLDLPVQHISDSVLKKMRRYTTGQETRDLLYRIREQVPGISLRTTLLVGHPGETEKDFMDLVDFVSGFKFERLGAFSYSHEEGTHAYAKYSDNIPDVEKKRRLDHIMEVQQGISRSHNNNKIGNTLKVIIEGKEGALYRGRSEFDSPEIDNEVLIEAPNSELVTGEFYHVEITGADDYDLFGRVN